jgi:ubiquinone/menaquinone biosynthesis C-methylase UbiE
MAGSLFPVGQDGILHAGWQPAPLDIEGDHGSGLPTRCRMPSCPTGAAFDRVASRYDELWTNTDVGRLQRRAVWRHVDSLFPKGTHIIDLGCGTGEDALHLSEAGVRVSAFDASPEMVRLSRDRGVNARVLAIEELQDLSGIYDGVISNFGVLNCVSDPAGLRLPLARLIRRGGHLAVCVIGRFCLWETIHFLSRGQIRKASRRWGGRSDSASLSLPVFYPSVRRLRRALAPDFWLSRTMGVGVCVPPSYVSTLTPKLLAHCDAIDQRIAHRRFFRALSDHRLLVFVRT